MPEDEWRPFRDEWLESMVNEWVKMIRHMEENDEIQCRHVFGPGAVMGSGQGTDGIATVDQSIQKGGFYNSRQ